MSELDLDAIEALADEAWTVSDREAVLDLVGVTRALVAEVRRLRAVEDSVARRMQTALDHAWQDGEARPITEFLARGTLESLGRPAE